MMKNFIFRLYSYFFIFCSRFRCNIYILNARLFNVNFNIASRSRLYIKNVFLRRVTVSIHDDGYNNKVFIQGQLSNSTIKIYGSENRIFFSGNCRLNNFELIVKGTGCVVYIGSNTTIGGCYMVCMGKKRHILIGKECMLADDIEIWASDSHAVLDANGVLLNPSGSVTIGKHVWIGKQVAIMKGVSIGDNAVIGMRSIVTKDIAAGTLNVGIPSKSIRKNINWDREYITKYEVQ